MQNDWLRIIWLAFLATLTTLGVYPLSRALVPWVIFLVAYILLYFSGRFDIVSEGIIIQTALLWANLLIFPGVFIFHVGRVHASAKQGPSLEITYVRSLCRVSIGDGTCVVLRLIVRNTSNSSISGVNVVIDSLRRIGGLETDSDAEKHSGNFLKLGMSKGLNQYVGLPLCVTKSRNSDIPLLLEKPESEATVHKRREVFFDFIRACKQPGNHCIQHASYRPNPLAAQGHPHPIEQQPRGVIPPGNYVFVLTVIGDNVEPVTKAFRVTAGEIEP